MTCAAFVTTPTAPRADDRRFVIGVVAVVGVVICAAEGDSR